MVVNIYFSLFFHFISICSFVFSLGCVSLFFVYQEPLSEKASVYECGFNAFYDARLHFDVRFYVVGLLSLILDLELMFLFPWIVVFSSLISVGFFSMSFSLLLLVIGFLYEIKCNCLSWK